MNAELGTPVKVTDQNSWGIPNIGLSQNLTSFGNPTSSPFQIDDKYFQFVDNFSWVIGKHSLRMGGEYRYNKFPQVGNEFPRGQFLFDSQFTNTITPTSATAATQTGGYTGADFMMGDMNNAIIAVALAQADFRNNEWATYIDDTWRFTPRLTLSLGFRWEVAQPMLDKARPRAECQAQPAASQRRQCAGSEQASGLRAHGHTANFYDGINFRYAPYYTTPGAATPPGPFLPCRPFATGGWASRLINTNYHDFAPRIGIAWSPSDKWSVRTGFGIFYSEESKNSIFDLRRGMGGRTGQAHAHHLRRADLQLHQFPRHVIASR